MSLGPPPKFCMHCGAPVGNQTASFCMVCGKPLHASSPDLFSNFNNGGSIFKGVPRIPENLDKIKYPALVSLVMPVLSFLFLTLSTVVIALIIVFSNPFLSLDFINSPEFLVVGLFLELLFIVPPFLYLRKNFPPHSTVMRFQVLGLPLGREKSKNTWLEVLIGLGVGVTMVFLVNGVQFLSEQFWGAIFGPDFVANGVNAFGETSMGVIPLNPLQLVFIWVGMFGAVGVSEEILYRGFTQRGLVQSWGKGAGILVTALLFTLAHILPGIVPLETFAVFFLPYFAISLLLGGMREWRKGNLLACIIAHGFYNSLIITIAFLGF